MAFVANYQEVAQQGGAFRKFEIIVQYSNNDKIEASFRDKENAINFLQYIEQGIPRKIENLSFNQLGMRDFFIAINPPSASWTNCAEDHVTKRLRKSVRLPKSKLTGDSHHQGFR